MSKELDQLRADVETLNTQGTLTAGALPAQQKFVAFMILHRLIHILRNIAVLIEKLEKEKSP